MTSRHLASAAATECLNLLPLLPIRLSDGADSGLPPSDTQSHATAANSAGARGRSVHLREADQHQLCGLLIRQDAAASADVLDRLPDLNLPAAQSCWDGQLDRAATAVLEARVSDAVVWLQRANAMKNRWEAASGQFLKLKPDHWITLSACSLAAGDDDTAAAFAVHAWQTATACWIDDFQQDFRSSVADAATVLALNRHRQRRPDRAAKLITCAIEGHRQVGDLEQLAADHLVLALCCDAETDVVGAADSRRFAARILTESLDPARHRRRTRLIDWLQRCDSPRPMLMKIV